MLRYQIFLSYGITFLSIWMGLMSKTPQDESVIYDVVIVYAPIWAILALGIYAATCVLIGLLSFKDVPEAATELEQHVKEAKKEMTKRGIISN